MTSIIYNYQGGAGGEGYAARKHGLAHTVSKTGKVKLADEKHNLPKTFVQEGRLFQGLMDIDEGIYLTHHLYLLTDSQLAHLGKRFIIVNIDSTEHKEEIFLLRLFKDYTRRMSDQTIPLILDGNVTLIDNAMGGCLLDHLDYGDSMVNKIQGIIAEYASHRGIFYNDNMKWHDYLDRVPGMKEKYVQKQSLGQIYLYGCYWNLDQLLGQLKNAY